MIGNPLDGVTRTDEILDKLAQHAIWRDRAAEKARAQQQGGNPGRHRRGLCSPRISARAPTARCPRSRSRRRAASRSTRCRRNGDRDRDGARQSRGGDHRRRGRRSRRWRKSMPSRPRHSSLPAIPTRSRRRRRTPRRATRAGCRRSARRRAHRSARISARIAHSRPRASSSASGCGRPRSNCGALRRPIRGRGNGTARGGRNASW